MPATTVGEQEDGPHSRQTNLEERLREKARRHEKVSKNVAAIHEERLTFGQRVSDKLAKGAGSWTFIFAFALTLALWVALNTLALFHHWDEYPYILLNLFLSMLAAIQAPVIMMSQNRTEDRDRLHAQNDYEVNLKAEIEIEQLHQKLDDLRERQWEELIAIQNRQIELLESQLSLLQSKAG
jgi:uncharacterized membrane protein